MILQPIRHRRDFLAAARARSKAMPGLVLQVRDREDNAPPRLGLTVTKKVGNAVTRNRIRRRLREAARLTLPGLALDGHDYVLIGRAATKVRRFDDLAADLRRALGRLHTDPT